MKVSTEERFWSKVKKGPGCWEWQAGCSSDGYGGFWFEGLMQYAHRVSFAMGHNIPKDMCVLHECDNPPCVRPSHLFLGTKADNTIDMMNKGRHGNTKLTEAQVGVIRCDPRIPRVIAKEYGISQSQVYRIKQRKFWKHVE